MTKTPLRYGSDYRPASPAETLNQAVMAHRAGNLVEAERLYGLVLAHDRRQFDALNMLGIVHAQRGDRKQAARFIERALRVNPRSAEALVNLGRVQFEMGELQRAIQSCGKAIALKPGFSLAHSNLAALFRNLGRLEEALSHCDKALASDPELVEALTNRGGILFDLRRFDGALASFDRALTLAPAAVEAWVGRSNACTELRRHDEAMAACRRALSLDPKLGEAWIALGNVLLALSRNDEAVAAYDRAIAADPNSARAWQARGHCAEMARRFSEAFAAYDKAMAIDPDLKYIEGRRLHAKLHLCDWANLAAESARLLANVKREKVATFPFKLIGISSSPAEQLKCARTHLANCNLLAPRRLPRDGRYGHDRIHVAYFSADFREHAVAYLLAGLFEKHDRARFRTIAVSLGNAKPSRMRARLESAFESFIDVGAASHADVAERLRQEEVDIAVDLMGLTHDFPATSFAARPAPVQVSFLGYAGTTGSNFIDYLIADRIVIPPDQQCHYSEKIVYMPDTLQANDDQRAIAPETPSRAAVGLPEHGIVFCCFNQNFKILPEVFDVWMRLLHAIDGSVVWVQEGEPAAARNLRNEAARRGIAPERIVIAAKIPAYEDHLARFRLADLFLDTLPYNAHTTASDALWAGLPVVTCIGSTFAGRVAGSLVHAVGLPELATQSLADYERIALALATDRERLAAIKARLAASRANCPLFDTDRFRRHLESAYLTMYERHQRGEPPDGFAVAAIDASR
jgi:protein O-GlcNAc transferase